MSFSFSFKNSPPQSSEGGNTSKISFGKPSNPELEPRKEPVPFTFSASSDSKPEQGNEPSSPSKSSENRPKFTFGSPSPAQTTKANPDDEPKSNEKEETPSSEPEKEPESKPATESNESSTAENQSEINQKAATTGFSKAKTSGFGSGKTATTVFGSGKTTTTGFGSGKTATTGFGSGKTATTGFGSGKTTITGFVSQQKESTATTGFGSGKTLSFKSASSPSPSAENKLQTVQSVDSDLVEEVRDIVNATLENEAPQQQIEELCRKIRPILIKQVKSDVKESLTQMRSLRNSPMAGGMFNPAFPGSCFGAPSFPGMFNSAFGSPAMAGFQPQTGMPFGQQPPRLFQPQPMMNQFNGYFNPQQMPMMQQPQFRYY